MRQKPFFWLIGLLVLALAVGCGGDDNGTNGNGDDEPEDLTIQQISVPQGLTEAATEEPMAAMAVGYVTLANSIAGYGSFFETPAASSSQTSGDTLTVTWSNGSLTVIMKYWETTTTDNWKIMLNGTDGSTVYVNWTFMEAEQNKSGTGGSLVIYDENTTTVILSWVWTIDTSDNITVVFTNYEDDERIEIVGNANGTGSVEYYENNVLLYEIEWYADGSGAWWNYSVTPNTNGTWSIT